MLGRIRNKSVSYAHGIFLFCTLFDDLLIWMISWIEFTNISYSNINADSDKNLEFHSNVKKTDGVRVT